MARDIDLERKWETLMSLCSKEKQFAEERSHPKLLQIVTKEIDRLAGEMGFTHRQIQGREFRAEKIEGRIRKLIVE
jgi:hypothetical protein